MTTATNESVDSTNYTVNVKLVNKYETVSYSVTG
jgi:hypothetical protein